MLLSVFFLGTLLGTSLAIEQASYVDVTPPVAKALIEKLPNIVIIDVSPAYAKGHLSNAVNYFIGDGSLDRAIPTLDKDKTYLVYCHVDSVAIRGAQKLVDAGFTKVYRLAGTTRHGLMPVIL